MGQAFPASSCSARLGSSPRENSEAQKVVLKIIAGRDASSLSSLNKQRELLIHCPLGQCWLIIAEIQFVWGADTCRAKVSSSLSPTTTMSTPSVQNLEEAATIASEFIASKWL